MLEDEMRTLKMTSQETGEPLEDRKICEQMLGKRP